MEEVIVGIWSLMKDNTDALTDWEINFVYDIYARYEKYKRNLNLSDRQHEILDQIKTKL